MPVSPDSLERVLEERFNVEKLCEGIDETLRSIACCTTEDLPMYLEVTSVAMPATVATAIALQYKVAGWAKVEFKHEKSDRTSWTQFRFWRELSTDEFLVTHLGECSLGYVGDVDGNFSPGRN